MTMRDDWDERPCRDEATILDRSCNKIKLVKSSFTSNTASQEDPALAVNFPDFLSIACTVREAGTSLKSSLLNDDDTCLVLDGNKIMVRKPKSTCELIDPGAPCN